jgi:hypothetical protein
MSAETNAAFRSLPVDVVLDSRNAIRKRAEPLFVNFARHRIGGRSLATGWLKGVGELKTWGDGGLGVFCLNTAATLAGWFAGMTDAEMIEAVKLGGETAQGDVQRLLGLAGKGI